jgi:hypothetical protein
MKLLQIFDKSVLISEANVAAKILKDPRQTKLLAIAFRHDHTIPAKISAQLGPRPTDEQVIKAWSALIDDTLRSNDYGDLSANGKFDDWLTKLYVNGLADYEDINGEGGDALGIWSALSKRGLLKPADQDFNKFTNIKQLQRLRNDRDYRRELERIKDAEHIEKMKRDKKDIVLVDNDRYYVILPLNYGACYTFGNAEGFKPNFCTNSSSGLQWFNRYSPDGAIISVVDKSNINDKDGKWQLHAATHQIVNGEQEDRNNVRKNDEKFSKLFPGLMQMIISALSSKAEEINAGSQDITRGGYNANKEIAKIEMEFPLSVASRVEEPEAEEEENPEDLTPGTWTVTHTPSNRTATIPANSKADLVRKLTDKYPDYPITDYSITKVD